MTHSTPADRATPADQNPAADDEPKRLSPEAQRALAEAAERRRLAAPGSKAAPAETGGRGGLDPARYGDWEKGGLAVDF